MGLSGLHKEGLFAQSSGLMQLTGGKQATGYNRKQIFQTLDFSDATKTNENPALNGQKNRKDDIFAPSMDVSSIDVAASPLAAPTITWS